MTARGHKFTREEGLIGSSKGGFTPERAREAAKKRNEQIKENKKKRVAFSELFEKYITAEKAEEIVQAIINMTLNDKIKPQDRLKSFELILRVLGEDTKLNTQELNSLQHYIKLEIS